MRICFVCEGSYPYVAGGVSSWLQGLISKLPEHEIVIWAIGANETQKGKYVYDIPKNVVHIEEVFLDSVLNKRREEVKKQKLTEKQYEEIRKLIGCENPDWDVVFETFRENATDPVQFLLDPAFLHMIKDIYIKKNSYAGFTDYFWTTRSMFLPLLHLMHVKLPEADLYHSISCGYAGMLASMAASNYHKPYVLTEHGIYTREREEEILLANWVKPPAFKSMWIDLFYMFSRCSYGRADVVTSLFHHAAETQAELGCPKDIQMVIPNGVDTELFGKVPLKNPDGYIDIGAIVRIVPIKDIKTMLFAFSIASEKNPRLRLHIMGPTDENPEYYQECLALKETLKLDNAIFTGRVKTVEYLEKIDFTLLTSISEGMPLSTLEGMAAGRPALTTNVGSCSELIYGVEDEYGPAGMCVPPMNQNAIAEAMLQLASNPQMIRKMGNAGQQRVFDIFRIEEMSAQYKASYAKAIETYKEKHPETKEQGKHKINRKG